MVHTREGSVYIGSSVCLINLWSFPKHKHPESKCHFGSLPSLLKAPFSFGSIIWSHINSCQMSQLVLLAFWDASTYPLDHWNAPQSPQFTQKKVSFSCGGTFLGYLPKAMLEIIIHQLIKMDPLWLCRSCNEEATFLDKPEGLLAVISSALIWQGFPAWKCLFPVV